MRGRTIASGASRIAGVARLGIGWDVAKPAVPHKAMIVSIAATTSSDARAKSRTERARRE